MDSMTAAEVKSKLALRHSRDIYFTEVKTGASYGNNSLGIIDAVAMPKSWTNFMITGYEVKVSRGDFLQDNKWTKYLDYCNELYFAVPNNLVAIEEVPESCGLIYVGKSTRKVKKAQYREIDINNASNMIFYLLMNYADGKSIPFYSSKKEYFERWLDNKISNQDLSYKIRNKITQELAKAETLSEKIKNGYEKYKKIEELFRKHNNSVWRMEQQIEIMLTEKNTFSDGEVRNMKQKLNDVIEALEGK